MTEFFCFISVSWYATLVSFCVATTFLVLFPTTLVSSAKLVSFPRKRESIANYSLHYLFSLTEAERILGRTLVRPESEHQVWFSTLATKAAALAGENEKVLAF